MLLFLFLTQYYFFIKYSKKIEKFNLKSYIILALLGSLAWGVNYWAATPSIYAIIYLHLEKYGLKKIGYIFLFSLIFFVFGILLNYLVTGHEILSLFYNPETIQANLKIIDLESSLKIFYQDLIISIILKKVFPTLFFFF